VTKAELEKEVARLKAELAQKAVVRATDAASLRGLVSEYHTKRDAEVPELVEKILAKCRGVAAEGRTSVALSPDIIGVFPALKEAIKQRGLFIWYGSYSGWIVDWENPPQSPPKPPRPWYLFWGRS